VHRCYLKLHSNSVIAASKNHSLICIAAPPETNEI
ncbi:unnamed protein product, partial [Heterotrigona itama]